MRKYNSMKKVSVIIPIYNAEKYLNECLDSILSQTYNNLEILAIDDGSEDTTASLIKSFADQDERIVAYYNDNHGVSYTRNFGLKHCTGEYVTFVDSDDIVSQDFIEQMVHDLEESKADIAVTNVTKNSVFKPEMFTNGDTILYKDSQMLEQLFEKFEGFLCNKLYKTNLILKNNIWLEEDIAVCEDLLFNVRYFLNCKKAVYNSGKKYFYRQISDSATNRLNNSKWFDTMKSYEQIIYLLQNYPSASKLAYFQYSMFLCAAKYRIRFIKDDDFGIKNKLRKEWKKMRPKWKYFSLKQKIKLYIFSILPKVIMKYQRRKL